MPTENSKLVHYVFVYGTLKKGEPNHHVLSDSSVGTYEFVGEARTVQKYPLVIASKYNIPFLLDVTDTQNGQHILGEIYRVDDVMLTNLDELESHPNFYVRRLDTVELVTDNDDQHRHVMSCWIYFLPTFQPELMNLPTYSKYSSLGDHGQQYVPRYARVNQYYSAMKDVVYGVSN